MHSTDAQVTVAFPLRGELIPRGDFSWDECPECGDQLETSQPLSDQPDQLVGACNNCDRLFLIHSLEDESTIRLPLPRHAVVRGRAEMASIGQ